MTFNFCHALSNCCNGNATRNRANAILSLFNAVHNATKGMPTDVILKVAQGITEQGLPHRKLNNIANDLQAEGTRNNSPVTIAESETDLQTLTLIPNTNPE